MRTWSTSDLWEFLLRRAKARFWQLQLLQSVCSCPWHLQIKRVDFKTTVIPHLSTSCRDSNLHKFSGPAKSLHWLGNMTQTQAEHCRETRLSHPYRQVSLVLNQFYFYSQRSGKTRSPANNVLDTDGEIPKTKIIESLPQVKQSKKTHLICPPLWSISECAFIIFLQ